MIAITFAHPVFSASLFNVTVSGSNLVIQTTTPSHPYIARLSNLSPGFSLANPTVNCKTRYNGDCVFTVSDAKAATIALSGPAAHHSFQLCINAPTPYNCEQFDIDFAYVANRGITLNGITGTKQISVCPIINGVMSTCTGENPGSVLTDPISVLLNTSGTYAYVLNSRQNTLSQCTLNYGALTSCSTIKGPFSLGTSIAKGPTGSLYVTNLGSNTITMCSTNNAGELVPDSCQNSSALFIRPTGIVINKKGTMAYVLNYTSNTISSCSLFSNGLINSCTENSDSTFNQPMSITMNEAETVVYITNKGSSNLSACRLVNGELTPCQIEPTIALSPPSRIALNKSETYAYITNLPTNSISICPMTAGDFGACSDFIDPTFGVVFDIAMTHAG